MINSKAIKPIKITAKAIDIGVSQTGTYFLDQSFYAASASFATPQLFTAKTFITPPSAAGAFKNILGKT